MGMGGGNHFGTRGMNSGMDRERRSIDRLIPLDHLALFVNQDQVRNPKLSEVEAKGIDPETFRVLGVADGDMAGNALVKTEPGEQAERGGEPLLAMAALFLEGGKSRGRREVFGSSRSFSHMVKSIESHSVHSPGFRYCYTRGPQLSLLAGKGVVCLQGGDRII